MNESTSVEVHKTFVVAFVAQFSPTLIKKEKKKRKNVNKYQYIYMNCFLKKTKQKIKMKMKMKRLVIPHSKGEWGVHN